jgi:large subunit ribosomal protein L15
MQLHELKSPRGFRKRKRIVGRGKGSGFGKTAGRGENGQRSRSGRWSVGASEGGQTPLIRRLPKVGFRSHFPINQVVNVSDLDRYNKDDIVNAESLKKQGLISSLNKPIKILGKGELETAVKVQIQSISKTAQEKIEKAGGSVEIVSKKKSQEEDSPSKK